VLFTIPEPLEVGERIEVRLAGHVGADRPFRLRGQVVRLEELSPSDADSSGTSPVEGAAPDRYEVGLALEGDSETEDLVEFLERFQQGRAGWPS
jgi:hypothetical protein